MLMYFGSVRFFKNLILVVVILAIGISAAFAFYYHHQWAQLASDPPNVEAEGDVTAYTSIQTDAIDYQSLYADFYAPQEYQATDRQSDRIYLTFDGAISENTADILAILDEKGVKATFFLSGTGVDDDTETIRSIIAAGHTVGMSSWSENYQNLYGSVNAYLEDVYQLFTYMRDTFGVTPTVFRFPGGSVNSYNAGFYRELIAEMVRRGFVPYDWNILLSDTGNGSQSLLNTTLERLQSMDRAILLLHGDSTSVELLPDLIDSLVERGYTCEALQANTKPVLFAYPK